VTFTPSHRGGSGTPLVCVHGFMESWHTWTLVLRALEGRHDVLAPTLPGHAGGAPVGSRLTEALMADAVEASMDAAGMDTAHVVGNSLGGYVALQLAERGRARSVVALAPAGGWAEDDQSYRELLSFQRQLQERARLSAGFADRLVASAEGRRQAMRLLVTNWQHIPAGLIVDELLALAGCDAAPALIDQALRSSWPLDAERIECPLRIVWGTADRLLPWPSAAARYRRLLPQADWIELDDVGHAPQLDVPVETAQLILGFTS
jgi:pimeloyl-ACP methyl ester carboxylesterase